MAQLKLPLPSIREVILMVVQLSWALLLAASLYYNMDKRVALLENNLAAEIASSATSKAALWQKINRQADTIECLLNERTCH